MSPQLRADFLAALGDLPRAPWTGVRRLWDPIRPFEDAVRDLVRARMDYQAHMARQSTLVLASDSMVNP